LSGEVDSNSNSKLDV